MRLLDRRDLFFASEKRAAAAQTRAGLRTSIGARDDDAAGSANAGSHDFGQA